MIEHSGQIDGLDDALQHIARAYVAARRRSGEALLEAAGYLVQAREQADHGQWYSFLRATDTGPDTAAALLNIHRLAIANTDFAAAVRCNWLSQTSAMLLARPSTPPEVVADLLARPESPTWREAAQAIKDTRPNPVALQDLEDQGNTGRWIYDNPATMPPNMYKPAASNGDGMAVHFTSNTAEWLTPSHIITRVLDMFEVIDLDPCSNSHQLPNVPAQHHYTQTDDGLKQSWFGYVYMNPPYGDEIGAWVAKLHQEFTEGRVALAIALLPARTDTTWFQVLWEYPLCFVRGRLKFSNAENSAPFPSVVAYLGDDTSSFMHYFGDMGNIAVAIGKRQAVKEATS